MNIQHTVGVQSSADIQEISRILAPYGIEHFGYTRVYQDGTRFCLISYIDYYMAFHSDPKLYQMGMFNKPCEQFKSGFSFPSMTEEHQKICEIKRNHFDIDNEICFKEVNPNYVDIYFFASKVLPYSLFNFYLNNLEIFHRFILYFNNKAAHLIQKAEQDRFIIPKVIQIPHPIVVDRLCEKIDHTQLFNTMKLKRYQFKMDNKETYLTSQERLCLSYTSQGKTAKEIARLLRLSPRTVEDHLNHVKMRFECKTKTELITKLYHLIR